MASYGDNYWRINGLKFHPHLYNSIGVINFPCAMVLTASFALSPVTGLSCHRRRWKLFANLTPASGRQDHTTSPSATSAFVYRAASRPPHPAPTFVTIAKRPSVWDGMARDMQVICVKREQKYFSRRGWTQNRN